jgi:kynurenine formamidase
MSSPPTFPITAVGTLAKIDSADVLAAGKLVTRGERFRLDLPIDQPSPPLFGRPPMDHKVLAVEGFERASDDVINDFNTQGSTHWDALRHQAGADGHYSGADPNDLGIEHFAAGIVGRAVLIDLGRTLGVAPDERRPVTGAEIDAAAAEQGVELRPRDILLLRTGWLASYLALDAADRPDLPAFAGLESSVASLDWLRERELTGIAADQLTVEVFPVEIENILHERMIPELGIAVGELFWLEELAADCAETGVWDSFLVSVPMRIPGACASPANAVVLR